MIFKCFESVPEISLPPCIGHIIELNKFHFLTHTLQDPALYSSTSAELNGKQLTDFFPSTCCLYYIEDLFQKSVYLCKHDQWLRNNRFTEFWP